MEQLCNHFLVNTTDPLNPCGLQSYLRPWANQYPRLSGETCHDWIVRLELVRTDEHQILISAAKDIQNGMSYADASIKYGRIFYPESENQGVKIVGGIVTGLVSGGPIGAVIGGAGVIAGLEAESKAAQKAVKKEVEQIKQVNTQIEKLQNELKMAGDVLASKNTTAKASFPELTILGKKISSVYLVIAGVLLSVMVLFIKKT